MNGDGDSSESTVENSHQQLQNKQSFEDVPEGLSNLVRDQYPSVAPTDQSLVSEAAAAVVTQPEGSEKMLSCIEQGQAAVKDQNKEDAEVHAITLADELQPVDAELSPVPESKADLPEIVSEEVIEAPVTEQLSNGDAMVANEKPKVSGDWNTALPNGSTAGWMSADAPAGSPNGTIRESASTEPGVLGSGPPPATQVAEQPPQQHYSYFMVRIPRPLDNRAKAEITVADYRLKEKTEERDIHSIAMQMQRAKCNEVFGKLKAARQYEGNCRKARQAKYEERRPLEEKMWHLKEAGRNARDRSRDLPASEADLDNRIAALEWRIQHESIPLKEEKQLMRDIKQLQSSRETVRANAAVNAQVHETLGQRDDIEEVLKPLNVELKQLKAEVEKATLIRESIESEHAQEVQALEVVHSQLDASNRVRQEAYEARKMLFRQESSRNDEFYNNKREIHQVKLLASQKNRQAVEDLCNAQVERILTLWNTNDEFRANYIKSNDRSTLKRLGTLDGRSLGPDEEPPLLSSYPDPVLPPVPVPQSKSLTTKSSPHGGNPVKEAAGTVVGKVKAFVGKDVKPDTAVANEQKSSGKGDSEETLVEPSVSGKAPSNTVLENDSSAEDKEREAAESKEKRRAAEMAKAKEAEERKKRMAEKSQSKALAWAQKEAERKEREKEKRARKKAASVTPAETPSPSDTSPLPESNESVSEIAEPIAEETKVSSRQRKRGVTNAQKRATKAAMANSVTIPSKNTSLKQNLYGLPLQMWLGIGSVIIIFVAVVCLLLWRTVGGEPSGGYKEGGRFMPTPDASPSWSSSYSQQ